MKVQKCSERNLIVLNLYSMFFLFNLAFRVLYGCRKGGGKGYLLWTVKKFFNSKTQVLLHVSFSVIFKTMFFKNEKSHPK